MPHPKRPVLPEIPISEEHILKADDPRPQYVPQYPSSPTRRPVKKQEEAIPTSIFDTEADQELQAQYGMGEQNYKPAFLYVERGPGMGQLLEVKQGTIVIGRASVADLRLQHPSVSRRHCQIRRVGEQFFVKDLGSQNGTFVNKTRIATEVEAKPGDHIALGNALVRLRGPLAKGEKLPHQAKPAPAPSPSPDRRDQERTRQVDRPRDLDRSRDAEDRKRISTAVVARPTTAGKSSNALKVAIFAGAVGFGLAAMLAFALIKAMSGNQPVAATPAAQPAAGSAATLPPSERERLIQEALAKKMAELKEAKAAEPAGQPAAAAPAEQPSVVEASPSVAIRRDPAVAAPPVVKAAPAVAAPVPSATKVAMAKVGKTQGGQSPDEAFGDDGESAAPAKGGATGGAKRAQLLASYEKGNAEGSLEAAKKAGDKDLVQKLTQFLTYYDSANEAMVGNNGTSAILNFQKALAIDEQLSNGWGKYGAEIRRHLANLYSLVGLQFVSSGETDKAKKAFQAALKHDPNNARAKAQLEKLGGAAEAADEPAPAKPAKKAPAKNAIDDAFGD